MELASSSSSFSRSKTQWIYDVFINFWGKDIHRSFVSHLHSALLQAEVNAFLDYECLLKGMQLEELVRAIEGSQIAIVVFSKTYTQSTWCLDELEKIIECHGTYGQRVVPVFYEIDPSDVGHRMGDFGKALEEAAHKRFSGKELESAFSRWSDALNKAANFSGWDVRNYRNEAELVKEIVNNVLNKLENEVLSITKLSVGLKSHVDKVIRFIENQSTKVCIIGIWGMGGSGKTTTAKAIYNRIHRRFMGRSFIEDIRQICQKDRRGHVRLQEQLLLDVLKTKVKIQSVGKGTVMIKGRLCRKRLLIVLDDVNEFDQLKDLCGNRQWFGQGTVIIITTRDLRLLNLLKVDYVYQMEEMDENESLELFSLHAFGEAKPREDFNQLARNVVAYCGGLPLALQVLGSFLFEKTKEVWESELSKLEITPNNQVQDRLRISFDDLHNQMEKDIFLDVCCFFIGKNRDYVTEILNGCGLLADIGITVLIECSLLKVEKNNKLGVHPLLQDMGKEIVRENSRKEPGKRSRLWFHEDVVEVLTKNTGTEVIEGMALKLNLTNIGCFKADAFKEMKSLRLLRLDHVDLTGDYGYLSKQLRWIYWKGFPLKYIPNNFHLEDVTVIDLKHSNLRLVWKETQVLWCLKLLNLSHSKYLTETPDFSKLPNLEKLILKDCPRLCKVHKSIGDLRNLILINLKNCVSLANLPRRAYKLKSVKSLILSGSSKIDKLEEDIVQMESLTTLIAKNTAVKQVPFSIVRSISIGYISLCGYEGLSLNVFPSIIWSWMSPTMNPLSHIRSFSGSSSLASMDMQNNDLGDLAPMLSSLSNLQSISVKCDTKSARFELLKQLTILEDIYSVNFTESEITLCTLQISKHYLSSYLIGVGSYQEVFSTLSNSISEGLASSESCDVFLPGDNYPYWLAHTGEGNSVYFTVPKDCCMKGMTLCVVYLSNPENTATECLISVLMVNYTKCTIQIHKRDTVIFFNDADWQGIISHFAPGDKVEIFVIFRNELAIKKTAVYLMCDKSIYLQIRMDTAETARLSRRQEFFEAMQRAKEYCGPAELQMQNEWLSNLVTFKLDKCILPYAIPSAILSRLNNLKNLEVQYSNQVEVIFCTNHTETMEITCQLEKLTLKGLSKLKRVVEKHILIFPNLREVIVQDCENLQILFPESVAKNLKELEKLEIKSCQKLQAIVETQTFTLECPALRILSVLDCDVLELFQSAYPTGEGGATSTSINILPFISDTKVIPNLEELTLDWKHISALSLRFTSEQFTEGLKYLKEISLHLGDDENEKSMLPVEILHKAPNAPNPKTSEDRMLGQFKISKLCEVSAVQSMELEDSSWLNKIYEKIQELNGVRCHPLKTLVQKLSFSCLKEVFISNCADLQYLFTSSAARKLMNLEKITVKKCESVKEIVAKEEDATSEAIKFERLNTIVLHSLPSLICFYSGSDTLQLSSLIKMHVWKCPNMKIFSHGVIDAKSFEGIQTSLDADAGTDPDAYLLFHQDLKATVKGMFQRQEFFKYLYETSFPEILADRHGNVPVGLQNRKLGPIRTLKLQKVSLPGAILAHLMNLDELELRDSDQEEVIFDLNDTEIMKTASHLKKLTLHGLSKLKRVWQKNSQGLLIFPDLRELVVSDCANLQTLFPVSLAKKLMELVKLEIKSCDKLQGIVEKEEETATNVTQKFVLPLENLDLCKLPQLTYFYPQAFTLEFPFLKILSVLDCDELELFQIQRAHPMGEGEGTSTSINRQPLVSNIKVIPKLKEMTLDWKHIFALSVSFMSEQFVEDLDYLEKIFLIFDAPENEKLTFPVEILQKAPKLKEMSINNCNSPEIFLAPNHKIGEDGMLGKLKILTLCQVSALQSIESKDPSWLNTICEKLHELYVVSCPHLTTLVHNTVSFSCLKKVSISNCPDLQYLFPSSAVKKLMNLEEITVKECKSVKEIVAKGDEDEHKGEGEDKDKNEMIFGKLKILKLGSLPEFESFYTGCSTLNFPSLREVWFTKCYGAKLFRLGVKVPTELKVTIDGFYWEDDINSAIMQQLEEEVA